MSPKFRDRHLYGAGAAACAVCCATPLLAVLGIAGAGLAATIAAVVLAGLAFGAVVLGASLLALWARRRNPEPGPARAGAAPVDVAISVGRPEAPEGFRPDR